MTAEPAAAATRCPRCGHARGLPCPLHGDHLRDVDGRAMRAPGPRFFALDAAGAFVTFYRTFFQVALHPDFVGTLGRAAWLNAFTTVPLAALVIIVGHEPRLDIAAALYLLPFLLELVCGAFLEPVANVAERRAAGRSLPGLPGGVRSVALVLRGRARALLVLIAGLPLLLLVLVPAVGPWLVLPVLLVPPSVFFLAPLQRRGMTAGAMVPLWRDNWATLCGFGVAFAVGALLPLFNMLVLAPTAAATAATLFLRMRKPA